MINQKHYASLFRYFFTLVPAISGAFYDSDLGGVILSMCIQPLSPIYDSLSTTHHSIADDFQWKISDSPSRKYSSYLIVCLNEEVSSNIWRLLDCLSGLKQDRSYFFCLRKV